MESHNQIEKREPADLLPNEASLRDWLLLIRAPGLGARRQRELLGHFGSASAIVADKGAALRAHANGSYGKALDWFAAPDDALLDADLAWLQEKDRYLIPCTDSRFPTRLNAAYGAPAALFLRGEPAVLSMPSIAMVGSRNPTRDGQALAGEFAAELAQAGLVVVSGLAIGIDGASHRGALSVNGLSVAVCATGLDKVYPARHLQLAQELESSGALVSEFPIGSSSRPGNFPRRNLTIAGLSLGVLVVEAARRSGSLITARDAMEQGRELFAIPGSVHNPLARGCHALIRDGAKLVETAEDVLEELRNIVELPDIDQIHSGGRGAPGRKTDNECDTGNQSAVAGDPEYDILLKMLGSEPLSVDDLVERSGLTADVVSSMLLILELDGHVEPRPGGGFQRCHS